VKFLKGVSAGVFMPLIATFGFVLSVKDDEVDSFEFGVFVGMWLTVGLVTYRLMS